MVPACPMVFVMACWRKNCRSTANVQGNWAAASNLNLKTTAGRRLQLTDLLGDPMKCESCGKTATFADPVHVVGPTNEGNDYRLICQACLESPTSWVPVEWMVVIDNQDKVWWERCIECRELKKTGEMIRMQPYCLSCY